MQIMKLPYTEVKFYHEVKSQTGLSSLRVSCKCALRKINWLPVSDRVKCCIANTVFKYWNRIVPGYIHEMFKPSFCRYNTRSQMPLDMPLRKTNTGQKSLFFLGPKIWSKIDPSIKNV